MNQKEILEVAKINEDKSLQKVIIQQLIASGMQPRLEILSDLKDNIPGLIALLESVEDPQFTARAFEIWIQEGNFQGLQALFNESYSATTDQIIQYIANTPSSGIQVRVVTAFLKNKRLNAGNVIDLINTHISKNKCTHLHALFDAIITDKIADSPRLLEILCKHLDNARCYSSVKNLIRFFFYDYVKKAVQNSNLVSIRCFLTDLKFQDTIFEAWTKVKDPIRKNTLLHNLLKKNFTLENGQIRHIAQKESAECLQTVLSSENYRPDRLVRWVLDSKESRQNKLKILLKNNISISKYLHEHIIVSNDFSMLKDIRLSEITINCADFIYNIIMKINSYCINRPSNESLVQMIKSIYRQEKYKFSDLDRIAINNNLPRIKDAAIRRNILDLCLKMGLPVDDNLIDDAIKNRDCKTLIILSSYVKTDKTAVEQNIIIKIIATYNATALLRPFIENTKGKIFFRYIAKAIEEQDADCLAYLLNRMKKYQGGFREVHFGALKKLLKNKSQNIKDVLRPFMPIASSIFTTPSNKDWLEALKDEVREKESSVFKQEYTPSLQRNAYLKQIKSRCKRKFNTKFSEVDDEAFSKLVTEALKKTRAPFVRKSTKALETLNKSQLIEYLLNELDDKEWLQVFADSWFDQFKVNNKNALPNEAIWKSKVNQKLPQPKNHKLTDEDLMDVFIINCLSLFTPQARKAFGKSRIMPLINQRRESLKKMLNEANLRRQISSEDLGEMTDQLMKEAVRLPKIPLYVVHSQNNTRYIPELSAILRKLDVEDFLKDTSLTAKIEDYTALHEITAKVIQSRIFKFRTEKNTEKLEEKRKKAADTAEKAENNMSDYTTAKNHVTCICARLEEMEEMEKGKLINPKGSDLHKLATFINNAWIEISAITTPGDKKSRVATFEGKFSYPIRLQKLKAFSTKILHTYKTGTGKVLNYKRLMLITRQSTIPEDDKKLAGIIGNILNEAKRLI